MKSQESTKTSKLTFGGSFSLFPIIQCVINFFCFLPINLFIVLITIKQSFLFFLWDKILTKAMDHFIYFLSHFGSRPISSSRAPYKY